MSLTRLFVNRPTLVFVIISLMTFAGIVSTMTIVKELFPNVEQPTVSIGVQYNGASVSVMRDNIVAPIEQHLSGTTDLQTINATVQQGSATITAVYYLGSDLSTDLALTNKAVQDSEKQLPLNLTPPTVNIRDPSESTVVTMAVFSKKLTRGELSLYINNVIVPRIQQIPGVSFANVGGLVTPAIEVQTDPALLAAHNMTLSDVINTVANNNSRVPGGFSTTPDRETAVDIRGDIVDVPSVQHLALIREQRRIDDRRDQQPSGRGLDLDGEQLGPPDRRRRSRSVREPARAAFRTDRRRARPVHLRPEDVGR